MQTGASPNKLMREIDQIASNLYDRAENDSDDDKSPLPPLKDTLPD